jgi:sensor histidine kinase YesM
LIIYCTESANFINTKQNLARETEKYLPQPPMADRINDTEDVKLNDTLIRLIGIPFFGITIPNVSGLFGHLKINEPVYWAGYLYFITLAALIWEGNRYLLFRTRKRFTWFDKPIEKLILLLVNNVFYTSPLTVAWLCVWYRLAGFEKVNWGVIQIVVLINVICVLFVTHVYETVFMVKEQQGEQLKNAELSRAKAEAELAALKNQIDPHFMFNSQNSLSYLISTDRQKASLFTENLAEVYRYILSQKDQPLVLLEDELDFTHKYTELLHLRFGKALVFQKHFNGTLEKSYLIPPTSVFVALENAVKHNEISEQYPLQVDIDLQEEHLIISNRIREKRNLQHSSRIGLKNLNERFRLLTGKNILSGKTEENFFKVQLPLIPLKG